MGSKEVHGTFLSVLVSWFSFFSFVDRSQAETRRSGPEASMVAAAKHFSRAHKVNLG